MHKLSSKLCSCYTKIYFKTVKNDDKKCSSFMFVKQLQQKAEKSKIITCFLGKKVIGWIQDS